MCVTWLVAEVAIALAYQMLLDVSNPFPAAAALLAAYLQQMPLAAEELAVVPALIKCRCVWIEYEFLSAASQTMRSCQK